MYMKRSGFLARKTPLKAYSSFKRGKTAKRVKDPSKAVKRPKLPAIKTIRTKADNLLTPIIKKQYPRCLLCSKPTEVGHHFFFKSQSNRLRYELDNIIPLCHKCHFSLHANENIHSSRIVAIKGAEWFGNLELTRREYCKTDVHWYIENHRRLEEILKSL